LAKLRRFLEKNAEGLRVERLGKEKLTVALLAKKLKVDRSTVQRYLQILERNGEIGRGQEGGRNGRLVIALLPAFGHPMSEAAEVASTVVSIPIAESELPTKGRSNSPERAAITTGFS
jgi:hypothetical protein